MPHFVIECSETVLLTHDENSINEAIFLVAKASELFTESDIKVRVKAFANYRVGNKKVDFIHVFADIMQGRTQVQKASLSNAIVSQLVSMFPSVDNIAMNVRDFEKATYCNKGMLK